MKVLVAGATGVVGKRTVARLVRAGHDVTGIARSAEKAAALEGLGAAPARIDLFDAVAMAAAAAGHQVVVNLATHIPRPNRAFNARAWEENDRIRREGSCILVDAALAGGVSRYIQESITFPYADGGDRWIDESAPLEPRAFLNSAADAESQAARFTMAGGVGVALRFAAFYSADSEQTQLLVRMASRHIGLALGGPATWHSSIHADDAAGAVIAALDVPAGVYNVADNEPITRRELAHIVGGAVGDRPWVRLPGRLVKLGGKRTRLMARSHRISNAKVKAVSGWTPQYPSVRHGLPAVVAELTAAIDAEEQTNA